MEMIESFDHQNHHPVDMVATDELKSKDYKIKNAMWFCDKCDIYCNSDSQFDVHMISQKHKFVLDEETRKLEDSIQGGEETNTSEVLDENNNLDVVKAETDNKDLVNVRGRANFSITEISQNPVALKFNINAVKYLIPNEKKLGKFEKFGFYCQTCDAYMTGQIQLVMHVRGAKHQFYFPNELPDYKPTKLYNPSHKKRHTITSDNDYQESPHNTQLRQILNKNTNKNDQLNAFYPQQNSQQLQQAQFFNNFQANQQQLALNLKFQQAYQYNNQMLANNGRQIRNFNNQSEESTLNKQPGFIQYSNNQYNQFWDYSQQQQQNIMQFNPNMSTPFGGGNNNKPVGQNQNNYQQAQFQSPIQYMMPQNSTPPPSFNRTPLPQHKLKEEDGGNSSFSTFGTPGGYPYYPQHAWMNAPQELIYF